MVFTRDELDEMYKKQLVTLAGYYGLDFNMKILKGDMIDKILSIGVVVEVEDPPMSVRVKRIRESNQE